MKPQEFNQAGEKYSEVIALIQKSAHDLHERVNQTYDKVHPYGFHLDMVASAVKKYGYAVCDSEEDVVPLFFGAFYHDSMEDARLTYNDVKRLAEQWMDGGHALMAAEMVYALTNEKGRTRAERANAKYYQGIRDTAYAPFLKLADRHANITYSCSHSNEANNYMRMVYQSEWPHFLQSIRSDKTDVRYALPKEMIDEIEEMINGLVR
ncbi:MAG: hypothetical protein ACI4BA_09550 [Prevotella sp.]